MEILDAEERGEIPEKVRRLLSDGYLCMYQNLDMIMFEVIYMYRLFKACVEHKGEGGEGAEIHQ